MTLQNRWGDNVEKDGGLLGPDGQPLSSSPKTSQENAPQAEAPQAEAEPHLDFFNYIASLGFQTMIFLGEMPTVVPDDTLCQSGKCDSGIWTESLQFRVPALVIL